MSAWQGIGRRRFALTGARAKRSNRKLFSPPRQSNETHLPALGHPAQTHARLSRPDEVSRWTQGPACAPLQRSCPAGRLTSAGDWFGLTRRHRLRGRAAFARVFRSGRRFEAGSLQILAVPTADGGRVGYVIGKKLLGRAVDRNRLKRLLREVIRRRRPAMNAFDLIIHLRRPCAAAELAGIAAEAGALLDGLLGQRTDTPR